MLHIYTVYPPDHQPQWPANDNEAKPSFTYKLIMGLVVALLLFAGPAAVIGGLLEMAAKP